MEHVIDDAAEAGVMQLRQSLQQVNSALTQAIYMGKQALAQRQVLAGVSQPQMAQQKEELRMKLAELQQVLKPVLNDNTNPARGSQAVAMTETEKQAIQDVNNAFKHDVAAYIIPKKPKGVQIQGAVPVHKEASLGR